MIPIFPDHNRADSLEATIATWGYSVGLNLASTKDEAQQLAEQLQGKAIHNKPGYVVGAVRLEDDSADGSKGRLVAVAERR